MVTHIQCLSGSLCVSQSDEEVCPLSQLLTVLFSSSGFDWLRYAVIPVLLIAVILVASGLGGKGGGKGGASGASKGRKAGDIGECSKCHQRGHNASTCSNPPAVASRQDVAGMQPIGSFFGAAGGSSSSVGGGGAGANRGLQPNAPCGGIQPPAEAAAPEGGGGERAAEAAAAAPLPNAFAMMGEGARQAAARDASAAAAAAAAAAAQNDDDEGEEDEGADDRPGHQYIADVYRRFRYYEKMHGKWPQDPLLGKPISPWVEPPDHRMMPLKSEPSACHLPRLYIWNPWSWGKEECGEIPYCPACGKELKKHGSVRKRMLVESMQVSWCMTPRFICNGCTSCKDGAKSRTWNGWDPDIRKGLPSGIQYMFPYDVQHRALVDVKLTNELVVMALNDTSVSAFTRIIDERAKNVFLYAEAAWKERLAAAKTANPQQSPFLDDPEVPLRDFGSFNDRKGYDGWCPKKNFWHRLLRKQTDAFQEQWTRELQLIDGTIFKGDHSRKTAKLIRIKGTRIFKSIYTLMNEYHQILGFWFTIGESLDELRDVLSGVAKRFSNHGFDGPVLYYTDSCCKEKQYLKTVRPSTVPLCAYSCICSLVS
jgi:hypothetical protein